MLQSAVNAETWATRARLAGPLMVAKQAVDVVELLCRDAQDLHVASSTRVQK